MDPNASASFIPKKNMDTVSARPGGHATGLLVLIAILIFVASVVAAGGVFAYDQILTQSIASKAASLALNQKAYDPDVIDELSRVDTRITQAQTLLQNHVAPSAIFALLAQQTLDQVQFSSYSYDLSADGSAKISMNGIADSFSTVALQSDQFGASKVLKDVVFSGVTVDAATGKVAFSDSSVILYTNALSAAPAAPAAGGDTQSATPPAATTTGQ